MITLDQLARGSQRKQEGATLDRPLEHLVACHRRIEDRLAILARAGNHLGQNRIEALEAIVNSLAFFSTNVARHNADEEHSFFPRLRERLPEEDLTLLGRLEGDHVVAEGLLTTLRSTAESIRNAGTDDDISELQQTFLDITAKLTELFLAHIAAEDEQLIELASRALPQDILLEISSEMKARRGQ